MAENLLDKTVNELMDKIGAGGHKPGSGSAAALQGMISAKLISTVISLTADDSRKHRYSHCITVLLDFQEQIENRIYPKLADLFQKDSDEFDKTINIRNARNNEKDEIQKNILRCKALEQLKISIQIPLEIASLSRELADIATYVFDNGFKAARGDSQVGLNAAVSAISGCIAIIRLNLLSFDSFDYEYCQTVVERIDELENDYHIFKSNVDLKIEMLKEEFEEQIPLLEGVNNLIKKYRSNKNYSVEECVSELQNFIWINKKLIWKKNTPKSYIEILQPDSILNKALGYAYLTSDKYAVLNDDGRTIEVAGVIDQPNRLVAVSDKNSLEAQRFTAAHELGHAILHQHPILHRDYQADFMGVKTTRDFKEIEADKFAANFLMPKKLLSKYFEAIFSISTFKIDDDTAFKFGGRSAVSLKKECRNLRELSRKLASTESYNDARFNSLAKTFNVSTEAMAIRLEELSLVRY